MIQVYLNGVLKTINENTKVIDLIDDNLKTNYMICQIDSQIKELRYPLTAKNNNAHITLLGINNIEAGKAYEATLRYIVAMAFNNLYKGNDIRFSYNVSRSILCQSLTDGFKVGDVLPNIMQEVKRIINANLAIERITVTKDEATKIYQEYSHLDKLEILKYRPEDTVHLYKCDNYYDYLHSYMLPSTGCIKKYKLKKYDDNIIIQYPRYELNARIPIFHKEATYSKTLNDAYSWNKKVNLQTIVGINHQVETGDITKFIQTCEARHNNMLADLGYKIEKRIKEIRLIAIAGPSSSGKTTFCNRLCIELLSRGIQPVTISMDDYYLEKDDICKIQNTTLDKIDLEHINCLDVELFNKDLYALIHGQEVTLPHFNFQTGKREMGKTIKVSSNSPIIIEGIHALNEILTASIPKKNKYKIYISPQAQVNIDDHTPLNTTDLRLIRRIVRDMKFRNCPAANTIKMWPSVRHGEFRWIYPNQEGVNYVFNSGLPYELCVLRTFALPALKEIKNTDPEYLVANRLIKYLKYFRPITDTSAIPCNSLMREFIGGSCFDV